MQVADHPAPCGPGLLLGGVGPDVLDYDVMDYEMAPLPLSAPSDAKPWFSNLWFSNVADAGALRLLYA